MSTQVAVTATAHAAADSDGIHGSPRPKWTPAQVRLTTKIAIGFIIGTLVVGVVGPIVLSIVIGLLQGYHRF